MHGALLALLLRALVRPNGEIAVQTSHYNPTIQDPLVDVYMHLNHEHNIEAVQQTLRTLNAVDAPDVARFIALSCRIASRDMEGLAVGPTVSNVGAFS